MRRLRTKIQPKDLPKICGDAYLDRDTERAVRALVSFAGSHSIYNRFTAEGVTNKWGHPAHFEAMALHVSHAPFPGMTPIESLVDQRPNLHLAVEDDVGNLHPWSKCHSSHPERIVNGIVLRDRRGRGWICGVDNPDENTESLLTRKDAIFTGSGPLTEVSLLTLPIVKALHIDKNEPRLLDAMSVFGGRLRLQGPVIAGTTQAPIRQVSDADAHLGPGIVHMQRRIDAILSREDRIIAAVKDHLTIDRLRSLLAPGKFPITDGLFPGFHHPGRRDFDKRLFDFSRQLGASLRDAGLCAPCPNGGAHLVRGIEAWNLFLEGRLDGREESYNGALFYRLHELSSAPFFELIRRGMISVAVDTPREFWEAQNPGGKYDYSVEAEISEAQFEIALNAFSDELMVSLYTEDDFHLIGMEMKSQLDERLRLCLMGSFLKPMLATSEGRPQVKTPLPVEDAPKAVRHIELSLRSGRLAMADWFRMEGFTEAVKAICNGDDFSIGFAAGRDERARSYFEKLGLIIVQVGNSSPHAYQDVPGIWRLGYVDEDHDTFWSKTGEKRAKAPLAEWQTCTDLWANTFADVEVIADILMASGKYEDRPAAMAALETAAVADEISIIDIGADKLHLYLPTGYGEGGHFKAAFRPSELEFPEWREDKYALSLRPLSIDADLLERNDWVEGRLDPDFVLSGPEDIEQQSPSP